MDLRFIVVAVVLALSFEDTVSQGDISDGIESRIVGGEEAFPGDFPYQVSVRLTNADRSHICGGIIVSPKHILTAAQCINFKPSLDIILKPENVSVYVGSVSQTSGGSYYTVATIQVHNSYSGLNLQNDIALLKLSKTLETTSSIQIIPMRQKSTPTAENCVTTGWGTLSQGATVIPDVLRFIELPIFDHAECKVRYSVGGVSAVNDKMICLGIVNDTRGICQGDTGGPLVCDGSLAGITSFNAGCDNVNPTVFTEVFKHQDWIKNAMNGALPTLPLSLTFFALLPLTLILLK